MEVTEKHDELVAVDFEKHVELVAVDSKVTSLIVGNLEKSVTQEELLKRIQVYGPANSCQIICDKISMQSLSYGYVNYEKAWHAALALQVLDNAA
ncbi:hypothetical protein SUGI_0434430 [Cryptomeria japonica]|nr:hypothetical protein SUGI_0434430 [Cryptomeria japonica]